jgi:hypothetical protein
MSRHLIDRTLVGGLQIPADEHGSLVLTLKGSSGTATRPGTARPPPAMRCPTRHNTSHARRRSRPTQAFRQQP